MDIELVDTSAWVAFFRGDGEAVRRVDSLLERDLARLCGPVYAEILSGARSKGQQDELKLYLRAIPWIVADEPAWERAALARFSLARIGQQCGLFRIAFGAPDQHVGGIEGVGEFVARDFRPMIVNGIGRIAIRNLKAHRGQKFGAPAGPRRGQSAAEEVAAQY